MSSCSRIPTWFESCDMGSSNWDASLADMYEEGELSADDLEEFETLEASLSTTPNLAILLKCAKLASPYWRELSAVRVTL